MEEYRSFFFVIPECEFYQKDATCKRSQIGSKEYGCNEMWCEKKIAKKEKKN